MGVHRKSSNHAVRGELGSYPLLIFMLYLSLKYWWKLNDDCLKGEQSLVIHALIENRKLNIDNYFSLSNEIQKLCDFIGYSEIWNKLNNVSKTALGKCTNLSLQNTYENAWKEWINSSNSKLRTYCKFKTMFQHENYLLFLNRQARSDMCKFRISARKVRVELGRYSKPKLNLEDRICRFCNSNEIEEEFHFIMRVSYIKINEKYLWRNCLVFMILEIYLINNYS